MKTGFKKFLLLVAGVAVVSGATTGAVSAQSVSQQAFNQIAVQLGALQFGYTTAANGPATNLTKNQLCLCLVQGTQSLYATSTNAYPKGTNSGFGPGYVSNLTNTSTLAAAQSASFREQLYYATLFALSNPVTYTNTFGATPVVVRDPVTHVLTTNTFTSLNLTPTGTVTTSIIGLAAGRIPILSAGLISNAVASAMSYTTNSNGIVFPTFGTQPTAAQIAAATNSQTVLSLNKTTAQGQLNNAKNAAVNALTYTLNAYTNGTVQWAGVPTNGPQTNTQYLPNYSTNKIPVTGTNYQAPNLIGIANAASAVSANAINGLGNFNVTTNNTTASLYQKTGPNVQTITKALVATATSFQPTSVATVTNGSTVSKGYTLQGVLGSSTFGVMTQVSGSNNNSWTNSQNYALVNGVVAGAVSGIQTNASFIPAVVMGVTQGFYATYLKTYSGVGPVLNNVQFNALNNTLIQQSFVAAGVSFSTIYSNQGVNQNLGGWITLSLNDLYAKYTANNYRAIAGASGIGWTNTNSGIFNGVGTPVTDTLGL